MHSGDIFALPCAVYNQITDTRTHVLIVSFTCTEGTKKGGSRILPNQERVTGTTASLQTCFRYRRTVSSGWQRIRRMFFERRPKTFQRYRTSCVCVCMCHKTGRVLLPSLAAVRTYGPDETRRSSFHSPAKGKKQKKHTHTPLSTLVGSRINYFPVCTGYVTFPCCCCCC